MNIWQKAGHIIKIERLKKSIINVFPYMDDNGQIWMHLFPAKNVSIKGLQSALAKWEIKSVPFYGTHCVSCSTSYSLDGQYHIFNRFMTESVFPGETRLTGPENCVRISQAEYVKNKDIIDALFPLRGANVLENGIRNAEALYLSNCIKDLFTVTGPTNGMAYYVFPKNTKDISALQQRFAKQGVELFEYKTSLSPNPVLVIKVSDLFEQSQETQSFFVCVLNRVKQRVQQYDKMNFMQKTK